MEQIRNLEVDTSVSVDDEHVRLPNGKVISKLNRAFAYRKGLLHGQPVKVDMAGKVYMDTPAGLLRLGPPKLSKAKKKAAKRAKVAARREATSGE